MARLTVRPATPDDAPELARSLNLFDGLGATPAQVAARLLACQHVLTTFLGALDRRPVGFACLRLVPHLQGVARALIARVEEAARAAGARGRDRHRL